MMYGASYVLFFVFLSSDFSSHPKETAYREPYQDPQIQSRAVWGPNYGIRISGGMRNNAKKSQTHHMLSISPSSFHPECSAFSYVIKNVVNFFVGHLTLLFFAQLLGCF